MLLLFLSIILVFLSFERHEVFILKLSSKTHLDHDVEVHLSFCLFHFLWNTFSKEVSTWSFYKTFFVKWEWCQYWNDILKCASASISFVMIFLFLCIVEKCERVKSLKYWFQFEYIWTSAKFEVYSIRFHSICVYENDSRLSECYNIVYANLIFSKDFCANSLFQSVNKLCWIQFIFVLELHKMSLRREFISPEMYVTWNLI